VSPTQHIPHAPSVVKTSQQSFRGEPADFDVFQHPSPCRFGIDNKFIPNSMLDSSSHPLFMVENLVITFDPDGPKGNPAKEMPDLYLFTILFGNPLSKKSLLPIKTIVVARLNFHALCTPRLSIPLYCHE
jgi:hypothetical protein